MYGESVAKRMAPHRNERLMLDVKASAMSGTAVGFLAGLSGFSYASSVSYELAGFGIASIVLWAIFGAIAGAIVAFVYNWFADLR